MCFCKFELLAHFVATLDGASLAVFAFYVQMLNKLTASWLYLVFLETRQGMSILLGEKKFFFPPDILNENNNLVIYPPATN